MASTAQRHPGNTVAPAIAPVSASTGPASIGLPVPLTSFVGRELEVEELCALIRRPEVRLVTLTGPGGVGKTRLALESASIVSKTDDFDIHFLSMESILDSNLVAPALGQAVGLAGTDAGNLPERLPMVLNDRPTLILLDNFEQILLAAPLVARILAATPMLKVLVTSRAPLRVSAERELAVGPLSLPEPGSLPDGIASAASVQLFLERATIGKEALPAGESASIAAICRRLDGMPLAIELAAAKSRILSPTEMLERMEQSLPLLVDGPRDAPARHQTLHNAISWSYDLLTSDEQSVFRALSVFDGGFTLSAAEEIAPHSLTVSPLSALTSLLDNNLVQRTSQENAPARYGMLETIREFGIELLVDSGEESSIRDRHLGWVIGQLDSPEPEDWFRLRCPLIEKKRNEQGNLRSALTRALNNGQSHSASHIAGCYIGYCKRNGLFKEAVSILSSLRVQTHSMNPIIHAGILYRLGQFEYMIGNLGEARASALEALRLTREAGYPEGSCSCLHLLALSVGWQDGRAAIKLLNESLEISRELADPLQYATDLRQRSFIAMLLGDLQSARDDMNIALPMLREMTDSQSNLAFAIVQSAWIAGLDGDIESAERLGLESLDLATQFGVPDCECISHRVLGEVAFQRGDYQQAAASFQRALRLTYRSAILLWEGLCYSDLGRVALAQGDASRAGRLQGAAVANWQRLNIVESTKLFASWPGNDEPVPDNRADDQYASAFAAGLSFSREQAYAEGMEVSCASGPAHSGGALLSSRELEVLGLIATGQTNREIAENLFVSKRTVDSHVHSILAKLGVDSRREAVASARQRGMFDS